ncbi:unnamed protein product [Closterium sp. NIES-65]|nr:unnamed protein product [Closterium sp. NIES-65]
MVQSGKTTRVILSGNCLTLSPRTKCTSKGTEHSATACQAFCSITDNGPCDGHGACVPATPTSPSYFTCICDAGYTTVDSGNDSSTCAIVHSTTNTVSSLSTGAIVGIVVGCFAGFTLLAAVVAWLLWPRGPSEPLNPFHIPPCCTYFLASFLAPHLSQFPCLSSALMLDSPLPSCSPLLCPHALLSSTLMLSSPLPSCSPLLCPHALLSSALMLSSPLPSCPALLCPHALLSSPLMLSSLLPSCSPFLCPHARLSSALMLSSPLPSFSPLLCPHALLSSALILSSPLPSCSPLLCPHARLYSALMLCPRIYTLSPSHLWSGIFLCAEKWEGLDVCEQFSLQQMLKATSNWSEDNVLGKGGFGIVYKGCSPQGQLWAIKRSTIMTNDFETEVQAMASLHHTHLVRLLGFCLDQNVETGKQEQILMYEFIGNRDLKYHIHKTKRPLSFRQRLRLAQGAAEGLAYLHGFDTPIVHRDIKPANILVTADMQAKVADFGLLKRLTHGDADVTRVAGTPGYVDSDYSRTHVITVKSDVFSFGIVLLELLSGKSPLVDEKTHIKKWAMKLVEVYELEELKDSKMPVASEEAIVDFADLALDCIKSPGTRRPTMKDVAYRLSALIAKHCPNKEDEWENVAEEDGASNVDTDEQASVPAPVHPLLLLYTSSWLCLASTQHPLMACFPSAASLLPTSPLSSSVTPIHC